MPKNNHENKMKKIKLILDELMRQYRFFNIVFSPLIKYRAHKHRANDHDWKKKNDSFNENGGRLLSFFKQCLDEDGLEFWLTSGTLLGAYREKKLLSHDIDIDVAMFAADKNKVKKVLLSKGFKLIHEFGVIGGEITEQSYEYLGNKMDIFFTPDDCENFVFNIFYREIESDRDDDFRVIEMRLPKSNLKQYDFLGGKYLIPEKTEAYLAANYGKNFMTPDKYWDYTKDIPSAIYYKAHEKSGFIKLP